MTRLAVNVSSLESFSRITMHKYNSKEMNPLLNADLIEPNSLSFEQLEFLHDLNTHLAQIENEIKVDFEKFNETVFERVLESDDWVKDYEIICSITFYLNEDDPSFDEDNENILGQLLESDSDNLDDGINHNEYQHWDHVMSKEHHCWLYHCLNVVTGMGLSNILRIGYIWVDFKVELQKSVTLNNAHELKR